MNPELLTLVAFLHLVFALRRPVAVDGRLVARLLVRTHGSVDVAHCTVLCRGLRTVGGLVGAGVRIQVCRGLGGTLTHCGDNRWGGICTRRILRAPLPVLLLRVVEGAFVAEPTKLKVRAAIRRAGASALLAFGISFAFAFAAAFAFATLARVVAASAMVALFPTAGAFAATAPAIAAAAAAVTAAAAAAVAAAIAATAAAAAAVVAATAATATAAAAAAAADAAAVAAAAAAGSQASAQAGPFWGRGPLYRGRCHGRGYG